MSPVSAPIASPKVVSYGIESTTGSQDDLGRPWITPEIELRPGIVDSLVLSWNKG